MFLLSQILSSFLSLSTTNSLIDTCDNFLEQDFAEIQNFVFPPYSTCQVALDATMKSAVFSIRILSSSSFFVKKPWYYLFVDIQTKELLRFILCWFSATRDSKIGRGRHEILMKETATKVFIRVISLGSFSFLRATSPIEAADNFPEPRPKICWNSSFIFSPHSTWQVAVDATMKIADFSIKILSSCSFLVLTPCYYPFLDIQTTELLRYIFWWSSQTKDPKIGRGRHETLMKKTAANVSSRAIFLGLF